MSDEIPADAEESKVVSTREVYEKLEAEHADDPVEEGDSPDDSEPIDAGEPVDEGDPIDDGTEIDEGTADPYADLAEDAPSSLNASERSGWGKWPADARDCIRRREREFNQGLQKAFQSAAQARRAAGELIEAVKPYENELRRSGATPAQVTARMLAWNQYQNQDPLSASVEFAQSCGITPQQLAHAMQNGIPQPDPQYQALSQELAETRAFLNQLTQGQQEAQANTIRNEAQAFAQEADAAGYLQDPAVYADWAHTADLIAARNPQQSLREIYQAAYDRVVWGDPQRRAALQKRESQKAEQERIRKEKAEAQKAARAGSSITGAPAASINKALPKDRRALIEELAAGGIA